MKLNLENDNQEIRTNDILSQQEEKDILSYIKTLEVSEYDDILKKDKRTSVFMALSSAAQNAINWFPMEKDACVLEIGAEFGSCTGVLADKVKEVVSVVWNKEQVEAIAKRHNDKDNVTVIAGLPKDRIVSQSFDYVVMLGTLSYADALWEDISYPEAVAKLIVFAKNHLKENGKILVAWDNPFGVKQFAGAVNRLQENAFDSICGKGNVWTKLQMNHLLDQENLQYVYWYPFPNYQVPSVIFSERYLPSAQDTKLHYQKVYSDSTQTVLEEFELLKNLVQQGAFEEVCNSFFLVISAQNIAKQTLPKFVSYNNMRKKQYRLMTTIYEQNVIKEAVSKDAQPHMKQIEQNMEGLTKYGFQLLDKVVQNKIESKFISVSTYDKVLNSLLMQEEIDAFYQAVEQWYSYIKEKFGTLHDIAYEDSVFANYDIVVPQEIYQKMDMVKDGYIDLVFENLFVQEGNYTYFDQEWYLTNVPLAILLYRSINNLYIYSPELEKVLSIQNIWEHFELTEFIPYFEQVEKEFQIIVKDNDREAFYQTMYEKSVAHQTYLESVKTAAKIRELEERVRPLEEHVRILEENKTYLESVIEDKDNYRHTLETEIGRLNTILEGIYSSRTWRYTQSLRNIGKKFKGKK